MFDFCAIPTGRCCPSYEAIREMTGLCFSTISAALLDKAIESTKETSQEPRDALNENFDCRHAFGGAGR
jgi:hypothetical protein